MLKPNLDYKFYDEGGAQRFRDMTKRGLVSLFLYSDRIYTNGEGKTLCDGERTLRLIAKGGIMYAPIFLFESLFGAKAVYSGDNANISLGELSFCDKVLVDNDIAYINPIACARALSIPSGLFYENRLLAFASEEVLSEFASDKEAIVAAAYLTVGEYDPYSLTSEDYKKARAKWRETIVGSPEINDLSNPSIAEKCRITSQNCKKVWESMNKGKDRVILWGDAAPTASEVLGRQYGNLATLARGYGTYGSDYYLNEELRIDIVEGIRWMYENLYGEAEIEGRGWRNPHAFNWYDWFIPAPTLMTEVFFILEDSFTLEERRKYLRLFEWYANTVRNDNNKDNSMARIGVYSQVGLATEKPDILMKACMDLDMVLTIYEKGEGPHVDFVHWAHRMPYNNAYGVMHLERALRAYSNIAGTAVQFKSPKLYNYFLFAKYMFEPTLHNGQAMVIMKGRQAEVNEYVTGASITWQLLTMYGLFGKDEDEYLANILRRQVTNPATFERIKSICSIKICELIGRLLKEGVEPPPYVYAHSWFTADRAVQHRENYTFALALSSYREPSFEAINWVNINGWHMGDGATYLYTGYDRHQYDKGNHYWTNKRIGYTYPGTTEDERERVEKGISYSDTYFSKNEFAGTMQIMDKYLLGAMDFISYNVDVPDNPDEPFSGGGGKKPYHINDLVAKKAYFALNDKIVCLGAAINSTMSSPVNTTIEHRRIVNKDTDPLYINGELLPFESYEKCYTGHPFFTFSGHAGFEILDDNKLIVTRYTSPEANNQDFIELKIPHGENPKGASYAYAIYPSPDYISKEDNLKSDFEIISNTAACQALKSIALDFTSYVFYEPCSLGIISVDAPSLVTITENEDNTITLMVCEPTHKRRDAVFTLEGEYCAVECSDKLSVSVSGNKTIVSADFTEANGRTYTVTLKAR